MILFTDSSWKHPRALNRREVGWVVGLLGWDVRGDGSGACLCTELGSSICTSEDCSLGNATQDQQRAVNVTTNNCCAPKLLLVSCAWWWTLQLFPSPNAYCDVDRDALLCRG